MNNQNYTPINHDNRPMVFVGDTYYNRMMYKNLQANNWECQLVKIEDILQNTRQWFDDHQFMAASSNVKTKRFITESLAQFHPTYFSVIGEGNKFDNVDIGRGVFMENYNTAICNDIVIGDHVSIANYVCLGHNATIGAYSHISSYAYLNFTTVGSGNCIASRVSVFGEKENILFTVDNCNFMTGGVVTKTITETGTYYGNRRVSGESSVSYDML